MGFNEKKYPQYTMTEALRLANLFTDNLHANLFVADRNGDIIYSNCKSAETYQVTMDELFTFNAFTMYEKGYTDSTPAVCEVLKTKKEVTRYIRTGKDVGMVISCKPIFDKNGDVAYAVATSYRDSDFVELVAQVNQEKDKLQTAVNYLNSLSGKEVFLDSRNVQMRSLYDLAQKAAQGDSVVMIYGASGTGKEVMAKHIHSNSKRRNAPFIPINCAAIPTELMESEFFGYEKGSFTGANEKGKPGLFEIASSGTLFLDEIGELTLPMQSKLLRVLESGEFMRIGSNKIVKTNTRIVGATNKELFKSVEEGTFRRDLYYRLNVIPIHLPSLKERPEDILPLSNYFLNYFNHKMGTKKKFSERTINFFQSYSWPGNIRELRNMIERLVVISDSSLIDLANEEGPYNPISPLSHNHNQEGNIMSLGESFNVTIGTQRDYSLPYKDALREFEQDYVSHVLERCGGNISKAAKELGLHRSSLYNILNR